MYKRLKAMMPDWVKHAYRKIFGKHGVQGVGRPLTVRESDVFIVSYPKSGNTWTRFIIGNLISEDEVNFLNVESRVPDIYVLPDSDLKKLKGPRIIKSHEYFDPRYKKVICIVRDPRDIAVSYMHFLRKMGWIPADSSMEAFIDKFLDGSLDSYGSWGDNVGSWLGARADDDGFLLLRYEDMLAAPGEALESISLFLGLNASQERIERAIELSSFDRMRSLEKDWKIMSQSDSKTSFMRAGKKGEGVKELPRSTINEIEEKWGGIMGKLGYLPVGVQDSPSQLKKES
ncbi:sulfotransferase domain-containing protein [Mariprofundus sp. KV]|uniref:sulfotransferase domain-containing protein n=1 Tax=Mariprofundus sp. KV TaxID=2608715 RepID=UPI0015A2B6E4|nr:sulfotransferase domain-containing protein [Mariprofundus sp. KV]NWF36773.1 sulfotransferase domain-containing protein [Mariprofundus sp. KV]